MRGKMIAGAAVAGIAGLVPAVTQAALLDLQLRITGAVGTDIAGSPTKSAIVTAGQVVTLDLYSVLNATDGTRTNDGMERSNGSFASSNGGLLGQFRGDAATSPNSTQNNVSPFTSAPSSTGGRLSDLDGDGDLDVGSFVTSGAISPFPWFDAISDLGTSPQLGTGAGNVLEQLIGRILFTVNGTSGSTSLNYVPRFFTSGTVATQRGQIFTIDGVRYTVNGVGTGVAGPSATAVSGTLSVGTPVVLGIVEAPEPASLGLLGIGAVALLRRRKA